jgi:hypothetical protein
VPGKSGCRLTVLLMDWPHVACVQAMWQVQAKAVASLFASARVERRRTPSSHAGRRFEYG